MQPMRFQYVSPSIYGNHSMHWKLQILAKTNLFGLLIPCTGGYKIVDFAGLCHRKSLSVNYHSMHWKLEILAKTNPFGLFSQNGAGI